jgi:hypothetical protein
LRYQAGGGTLTANGGIEEISRRYTSRKDLPMTAAPTLDPAPVNVRIKLSALWASMLFVFAYVDLFSLYRPDFRAAIEAGEISGFTINQWFLLGATIYTIIPSLMVVGALVLSPRVNRIVNIALGSVYALTIVAGAIGEWHYYVLGSAIEVALLAAIVYFAWTWPKALPAAVTVAEDAPLVNQAAAP